MPNPPADDPSTATRSDAPAEAPASAGPRRLNANVPAAMMDEMAEEKRRSGREITDLVKLGWSLTKIALREQRAGNALAVLGPDGRVLKEIVVPD
jgi:hypothetical protein